MDTNVERISHLRIELDGDFWGRSALSLADQLPLADLADAKCVVLSLGKVLHTDQAGLAMLVRLYSHLRVRGCELRLVDVPGVVHELLERVGLADLVTRGEGLEPDVVRHTIVLGVRAET